MDFVDMFLLVILYLTIRQYDTRTTNTRGSVRDFW